MNNIVCYTCITGGYDKLHVPVECKGIDFICFSDRPACAPVWQFRQIPEDLRYLSLVKQQRVVKICPHRYLREYDTSIWVDGNISIIGDLSKFIRQYNLDRTPFYTRIHPSRHCIYAEAQACIDLGKASAEEVSSQMARYQAEGYPKDLGMVESNIMLRRHNDSDCVLLDNLWATELIKGSHRDQLSFNYACWKRHFAPGYLTSEFSINNQFFRISCHGH